MCRQVCHMHMKFAEVWAAQLTLLKRCSGMSQSTALRQFDSVAVASLRMISAQICRWRWVRPIYLHRRGWIAYELCCVRRWSPALVSVLPVRDPDPRGACICRRRAPAAPWPNLIELVDAHFEYQLNARQRQRSSCAHPLTRMRLSASDAATVRMRTGDPNSALSRWRLRPRGGRVQTWKQSTRWTGWRVSPPIRMRSAKPMSGWSTAVPSRHIWQPVRTRVLSSDGAVWQLKREISRQNGQCVANSRFAAAEFVHGRHADAQYMCTRADAQYTADRLNRLAWARDPTAFVSIRSMQAEPGFLRHSACMGGGSPQ